MERGISLDEIAASTCLSRAGLARVATGRYEPIAAELAARVDAYGDEFVRMRD